MHLSGFDNIQNVTLKRRQFHSYPRKTIVRPEVMKENWS